MEHMDATMIKFLMEYCLICTYCITFNEAYFVIIGNYFILFSKSETRVALFLYVVFTGYLIFVPETSSGGK
jgi:hypothetical protein